LAVAKKRKPLELAGEAVPKKRARGQYQRGRSPEQRRDDQRLRLLAAAAEIFAKHGYAGASVELIVDRAGMSRRTFYEHFTDLRDVLLHLHDVAAGQTLNELENFAKEGSSPAEKLTVGIHAFLSGLGRHGDLARVMWREIRAAGPEQEARVMAVKARFAKVIEQGLDAARAKGLTTHPTDEMLIFALVSAIEAVGMRYVQRHEEHRAVEAVPMLVELVLRALA
jgi:AcrR family transcriptional regulator